MKGIAPVTASVTASVTPNHLLKSFYYMHVSDSLTFYTDFRRNCFEIANIS